MFHRWEVLNHKLCSCKLCLILEAHGGKFYPVVVARHVLAVNIVQGLKVGGQSSFDAMVEYSVLRDD